MNAIATETRLPAVTIPPLAGPLDAYYEKAPCLPAETVVPEEKPRILRLSQVTKATMFYSSPSLPEMAFTGRGVVNEASAYLSHHRDRWANHGASAYVIAEALQERFYGGPTRGFLRGLEPFRRTPRKGWALLAATEELGLVSWQCHAPSTTDHWSYEPMSLSAALALTNHGKPGQASALASSGSP